MCCHGYIVVIRKMGQRSGVRGAGAGGVGVGPQYLSAGIHSHKTLEYPAAVTFSAIAVSYSE